MSRLLNAILLLVFCITMTSSVIFPLLPTADRQATTVLLPGTKWCGAGDIARSYDDLGIFREADICCRDHDHCPEYIDGGQTKYGLTNTRWYSKMNCDCDTKFKGCLANNTDIASLKIMVLYFNFFQPQCFKKDFPSKCEHYYDWVVPQRCQKYVMDTSADKFYQYFDNPIVNGI